MRRSRGGMLVVTIALTVGGCGRFRDMVSGVIQMQHCLTQDGGTSSVNINQTDKRVTITLVNSPLDTLPAEARSAGARRVALCVRDNYPAYQSLTEVAIAFERRASAGPVNVASTSGTRLVFATRDLGAPHAPASDSGAAKAASPN